nr:hypothetical protein [Burkholderia pseudomallei]
MRVADLFVVRLQRGPNGERIQRHGNQERNGVNRGMGRARKPARGVQADGEPACAAGRSV